MDKQTQRYLIIGAVAIIFGPTIIRKLIEGISSQASQLASDVIAKVEDTGTNVANTVLNTTSQAPVYVGGQISYPELVAQFGDACASVIVTSDTLGKLIHCPWGWQDTVQKMQAAKVSASQNTVPSGMGEFIDLTRGKNGVFYAPKSRG